MGILILSGPSAAGKNTVATLLAKRVSHSVIVDVDMVRHMSTRADDMPNAAFVEITRSGLLPAVSASHYKGDEWRPGIHAVIALTRQFAADGFHVIIVEVLSDASVSYLREGLGEFGLAVVHLLPSRQAMWERFRGRANMQGFDCLTAEEVEAIYSHQRSFTGYDWLIDNTLLPAEQVAEQLLPLLRHDATI